MDTGTLTDPLDDLTPSRPCKDSCSPATQTPLCSPTYVLGTGGSLRLERDPSYFQGSALSVSVNLRACNFLFCLGPLF